MSEKRSGVARYENVGDDYLKNRKLRKSAGWILLWALGVGAVISGDYFGWNFGLAVGGFWGLAGATVLMAVMYVCMVFTIAELSAALPHAGGFFSFTRNAFGPTGGFICGITDTIEYVITPAVIVVGIGGYLNTLIFGSSENAPFGAAFLWWFLAYAIFVTINIRGVELTLKVGLVITALAAAVLIVFYISAIASGEFDSQKLFNIVPDEGHTAEGLPFGFYGMFAALPFAIWFFLAIEQLPLAAEEAHDVARDMPKALIFGIAALLLLSLFTLVLNTGVGGGASAIGNSDAPLADGFQAIFGKGTMAWILTLIGLTGLIASFHTIIYAYGRVLFALSRAGYIPRWISLTGRNNTPYAALILGAVVGLGCASLIEFTKTDKPAVTPTHDHGGQSEVKPSEVNRDQNAKQDAIVGQDDQPIAPKKTESFVGKVLLNMAVFGAVISYCMVMFSYIKLRISNPGLPRPYRSPLGIPGAAVGAALSILALLATFSVEQYRPGVWGVAVFLLVGIVYFFVYSRHRLVAQAPEEENALIAQAEKELTHQ